MKLKKMHLFLILVAVLVLASFGFSVQEGLENMRNKQLEREDAYQNELEERYSGKKEHRGDRNNSYILKSEVVPPVCPKCPQRTACPRPKPCPACPPCARCPEPAFECKKVPNYSSSNNSKLPLPMLNSFAQF